MAGRNHIPLSGLKHRSDHRRIDDSAPLHPHRRLNPAEFHIIEDRIASQSREIQTLLFDNQRLAASHVALKQDVADAQQELRRLCATASSVKAERDAQVREVYERSLKLEAEAWSVDGLAAELDRVRAEIKELRDERKELSEKLTDIEGDISRSHPELQEFSNLKTEIEAWQREIRRGRAAIEYERKMHSNNFELSEAMEKHMMSMAHEAEKLRTELANAEQRAMAAVEGAVSAANQGPGYAIQQPGHAIQQPGYGGNSLSDPHVVQPGHGGNSKSDPHVVQPGNGGNSLSDPHVVQPGHGGNSKSDPHVVKAGYGGNLLSDPHVVQPGYSGNSLSDSHVVQPGCGGNSSSDPQVLQPGYGGNLSSDPHVGQPGYGGNSSSDPHVVQPGYGGNSSSDPHVVHQIDELGAGLEAVDTVNG